jgi:aldose 1-epimerase
MLHEFSVLQQGSRINIVDSYTDASDFDANAESRGFKSSKLSPFVCRLKNGSYTFEGTAYKTNGFYLPPHAIHGLLYRKPFRVVEAQAGNEGAVLKLVFEYRGDDAGYPFSFNCTVVYSLLNNNALQVGTTITNKSVCHIPVADGWHPYFTVGNSINDAALFFNSRQQVAFDETLIPTGNLIDYTDFNTLQQIGDTFFDNCFLLPATNNEPCCILKNGHTNLQLEITALKNYPYLQLYTPPHRQSIAIENLSAAPDAFNNGMGLKILKANEEAEFKVEYRIVL